MSKLSLIWKVRQSSLNLRKLTGSGWLDRRRPPLPGDKRRDDRGVYGGTSSERHCCGCRCLRVWHHSVRVRQAHLSRSSLTSSTDFIQFQQYLNVSGLDMAIVGHSYFYHTRDDTLENIERGSAQHFCDNAMGVVDFLLSPASPLSKSDWSEPDVVYLSLYDRVFVHWKMSSADTAYTVIAAIVTLLTIANINWQSFTPFMIALVGTPIGFAVGLLWANFLAQWLDSRRWGLLWFRHEHLSLLVYCPIAYAGNFATQYVLASFLDTPELPLLEHSYYYAQITFSAMMMLGLQALRIRSAYIFAVLTSFMMIGAMGNEAMSLLKGVRYKVGRVSGYILPLAGLMVLGVEAVTNVRFRLLFIDSADGRHSTSLHL